MNVALDVAIGLAFVFLLFSVIASALVEWVSAWRDRRAASLKSALTAVLGAPLTTELLNHPAICGIQPPSPCPQAARLPTPSYLSPKAVALALADIARQPVVSAGGTHDPLRELMRALKSDLAPPGGPAAVAIDQEVLFRVERWFTEQMNRATASYKRWTQVGTLVAAALLTLAFDIDTTRVAQRLYSDAAVRTALSATATGEVVGKTLAQLDSSIRLLDTLPVGWSRSPKDLFSGGLWPPVVALAGWMLSIIAIGFGAPFWFDTLNRIVSLRQTGPRPATTMVAE